MIVISSITDMPTLARDFITMEIELYNQDAVEDKNLMANNTAVFLKERLDLLKQDLVMAEMKNPATPKEQGRELLVKYKELKDAEKRLAKDCGDRVLK